MEALKFSHVFPNNYHKDGVTRFMIDICLITYRNRIDDESFISVPFIDFCDISN